MAHVSKPWWPFHLFHSVDAPTRPRKYLCRRNCGTFVTGSTASHRKEDANTLFRFCIPYPRAPAPILWPPLGLCKCFHEYETGMRVLFTACLSHFIKTINIILCKEGLKRLFKNFCKKLPKIPSLWMNQLWLVSSLSIILVNMYPRETLAPIWNREKPPEFQQTPSLVFTTYFKKLLLYIDWLKAL